MTKDELENEEGKARARCEPGVHEPETGRRHRLTKSADPTDERIGDKEGDVIETDHRGVDLLRRDLREKGATDRQKMSEADAVEEMEGARPGEPDLRPPGALVTAAMKRQSIPATEKIEPIMILVISSGSRQRLPDQR